MNRKGKIITRKSKPTSYEAAKSLVIMNEIVTAQLLIDRLIDKGRREIPTKRSLSAMMKKDHDFEVVPATNSRGPTTFRRIA